MRFSISKQVFVVWMTALALVAATGCGNSTDKKPNSDDGSTNNTATNNTTPNNSTNNTTPNNSTNNTTPNNTTNNNTTNNGTNNGTNNTTNNATNNTTNNTTNNMTNNMTGPYCDFAGDTCVAGEATNAGFVCIDDVCREECNPNADPTDCQPGAVCLPASQNGPSYCQPSDCNGWLDTTSCDPGFKCTEFSNDASICVEEGPGGKGEACQDFGECQAGLICVLGECSTICGGDADCDAGGGERCIDDTLDAGVGFCAVGCDSYSLGQCPVGQGCFPITADDGVCDDVGTVAPFQPCSQGECGENTACITFQGEDAAAGIPAVGRCLPFCNAAAGSQSAADSTCQTSGTLGAHCLNLDAENPSPTSGFCLESCPDSDTFGTDACSGPSDYCTPARGGELLCFPGGPNTTGESCNPDDSTDGCDGVSWCELYGDRAGTCRAYCQPQTQSNAGLGCTTDGTCVDVDGVANLGRCRTECTPTNFSDTASCPANLESCVPVDRGEPAYCSASGSTALGGTCEPFAGDCGAGDACMNDLSRGDFTAPDPLADGVCTNLCDPFATGSECDATEVCAINFLTLNRAAGLCTTPDENVAPNGACASEFSVCGQRSLCLDLGAGPTCLEMCDLDDATTCDGGSCTQLFNNADIRLGGCL